VAVPAGKIVNGWPQNPAYNAARDGDVPGAELLGKRQEDFLGRWARDWSGGAWMKDRDFADHLRRRGDAPRGCQQRRHHPSCG
jgi:hypothetical protein